MTVVASLIVTVTLTTSPTFRLLFWMPVALVMATLLTVGPAVSTLMARVPAALVLPAASVWVALRVSAPWPIAVMSAAVSV